MSSVSSISGETSSLPAAAQSKAAAPAPQARAADGDTVAQESAESNVSKQAEKLGGGFAPNSSGAVNKIA